jgi:hypothetical protein
MDQTYAAHINAATSVINLGVSIKDGFEELWEDFSSRCGRSGKILLLTNEGTHNGCFIYVTGLTDSKNTKLIGVIITYKPAEIQGETIFEISVDKEFGLNDALKYNSIYAVDPGELGSIISYIKEELDTCDPIFATGYNFSGNISID